MEDGFALRKKDEIPYYACLAIEKLPSFRHGFSTRALNLGYTHWDFPERVANNRKRFLAALNLDQAQLATLHQIHSDRVHIIKDVADQWNQADGDALVTRIENCALAIQTADCLPILIADPQKKVAAVVHSGWRGTRARILQKTIEAMEREFGSDPARLVAAIGPGIRACCFEVDEAVAELFIRELDGCLAKPVDERPGKFLVDLPRALKLQLKCSGIKSENSHDIGTCTRCNSNEFFSYRAEGQNSGRMMAVIGILERGHPARIAGQRPALPVRPLV
jgi:polyphenol oxidase